MKNVLRAMKGQKGQGLVEYALILVIVSVAVIATLATMQANIAGVFTAVSSALSGA